MSQFLKTTTISPWVFSKNTLDVFTSVPTMLAEVLISTFYGTLFDFSDRKVLEN